MSEVRQIAAAALKEKMKTIIRVDKWKNGQVDKWTSRQVDKWPSGQVDK
jgi:hypothetical protein